MDSVLRGFPESASGEEQVLWLKARLLNLQEDTHARIAALEARQAEVERRMACYEDRLAEQERRIDEIEEKLEAARRGEVFSGLATHEIPPTRH